MHLKNKHTIVESGIVFTYFKELGGIIEWSVPEAELRDFVPVEPHSVNTVQDMEQEIAWFIYHNPELVRNEDED